MCFAVASLQERNCKVHRLLRNTSTPNSVWVHSRTFNNATRGGTLCNPAVRRHKAFAEKDSVLGHPRFGPAGKKVKHIMCFFPTSSGM